MYNFVVSAFVLLFQTKTQMNDLMDGLIQDMSTGIYTTKRPYPVQRYVLAHNSNVSWNLPNISGVVSCLLDPLHTTLFLNMLS